jgi:hypothetical protein
LNLIFDLIDMRSFSNLWYWIALAVTWSSMSHWVIGVPYDIIQRARKKGGEAADDLEALTRINVARLLYIGREAGVALVIILSFALTSLILLGFVYNAEFAQALSLIALPLTIVGAMSFRTAQKIDAEIAAGRTNAVTISEQLTRHRMKVQIIGMASISITAFWGMLQNVQISILN